MNTKGAVNWGVVFAIAAVLFIIGLVIGGQLMFAGVLLVLLIILGGGALLYRTRGPAEP